MKKSTLYVNGRIYTMDPDNTVYEAMAVEDGRIVRLGTTKELMEEMAPDQELEDLKGCPVLPGMCDCHVHMDMTGAIMVSIDAAGKGKEELLEEVRMRAQSLEKGKWITGMGWKIPDKGRTGCGVPGSSGQADPLLWSCVLVQQPGAGAGWIPSG